MTLVRRVPAFPRQRFEQRFAALSAIGSDASGALNRAFGSDADRQARQWLCTVATAAGFAVKTDAVGNIWGRQLGDPRLPALTLGSHHDSVPDGGRFDGALGVLMAIEVIQSLAESGWRPRHPLQFVSFTAEEPNPFELSTLGSRTVAGRLTDQQLRAAQDWSGRSLADAVAAVGGNLDDVHLARKTARDVAAFLELHIEQGRRLEKQGVPVGIVSGICGIYRESVTVVGEANHAGTTQLPDRRDALLAACEMVLAVERQLQAAQNPELMATVGRLAVIPNAVNIVPGECTWNLEIRGSDMASVYALRDSCGQQLADIARRRDVSVNRGVLLDQQPQPMAAPIIHQLQSAAAQMGIPFLDLASMAGHDATHMASFTQAGMVFVPSLGGKSHCKEEQSTLADIEQAFLVLAATTIALDADLDL